MPEPWLQFEMLKRELSEFNETLNERPQIIIANKIDLLDGDVLDECLNAFRNNVRFSIMPISAKNGDNLNELLIEVKKLTDDVE